MICAFVDFAPLKGLLLMALPIAGSVLLAYGVFQVAMDFRGRDRRRLLARLREDQGRERKDKRVRDSLLRRRAAELEKGRLDSFVSNFSFVPKLQRVLDQANLDWSASRLLVNLAGVAALVFFGLLLLHGGLVVAAGGAGAVVALPLLYLARRRKKRINKLVQQLPDVFELCSQALRAGHSLASGIHLVSQQMPDPAGTEFARVFHEQNLGIKIEEALKNMADRVDQLDVRFFVTAVLIQRQTGGDLAEVLDKIGTVIRDRIHLFGQVQALTAEGRLSGWVLLALPVLVFFVELFLNPDYAGMLLYDPTGRFLLFTAIAMQLMGMAMIKKIVNIKV